jgi:large subunit ribosomal protein L3
MAGHMGCKWRELKGLRIFRINTKYNVLYVNGPVMPGPMHCYVRVVDSCLPKHREKITAENHPPFPTFYEDDLKEPLPEEIFDSNLHRFTEPTIDFASFEIKKTVKREGAKLAKIKS